MFLTTYEVYLDIIKYSHLVSKSITFQNRPYIQQMVSKGMNRGAEQLVRFYCYYFFIDIVLTHLSTVAFIQPETFWVGE